MSNLQPEINPEAQSELQADVQADIQANLQASSQVTASNQVTAINTPDTPEPDFVPKGYVIKSYLGSGQTADIYLAKHKQYGEVALKLIRPSIKGIYAHTHMFTNEVYLTTRLEHPYVIAAYDGDPTENNAYLALEHCAGGTLDSYLTKHGQFDLQQTYKLILQIALGLSFSHTRGILHRDVKPANILLKANGDARLADYGTGVYIDKVPKDEKVGTVYYMAPEIFKGRKASVQSDVYSLGVLAYELLTAKRPFQGKTYNELMQAHLSNVPANPKHLRKDLDKSVAFAIMKAMSGSPEKRFKTVAEFKETLEKVMKVDVSEQAVPMVVGRKSRSAETSKTVSAKTTPVDGDALEVTTPKKTDVQDKPQGFIRRFFSKKS